MPSLAFVLMLVCAGQGWDDFDFEESVPKAAVLSYIKGHVNALDASQQMQLQASKVRLSKAVDLSQGTCDKGNSCREWRQTRKLRNLAVPCHWLILEFEGGGGSLWKFAELAHAVLVGWYRSSDNQTTPGTAST